MNRDEYNKLSLLLHRSKQGKLEIASKFPLDNSEDLSIAYTPGVAEPCRVIAKDPKKAYSLTMKGNSVAVVTDGSAVLGLGDIGPEAALPVMEGKAVLFKKFANINAIPICLNTQNTEEIIQTVKNIAPTFGGINLEDISAPRCFEIEQRLSQELNIPVFHDDQHGTAIVTLAGLINALKIVNKDISNIKVVINGAGAAGIAIANLLLSYGVIAIILCDTTGIIYQGRERLNPMKQIIADQTNLVCTLDPNHPGCRKGSLEDALVDADIFIGVSKGNILTKEMIRSMNPDPIIFAMANPDPEVLPDIAMEGGCRVIATGRSDYPNQVNNVLVFPGIFRGALNARVRNITISMKLAAAKAIAELVQNPKPQLFIPHPFHPGVTNAVANAVEKEAQ